jgi:hypothetical protein
LGEGGFAVETAGFLGWDASSREGCALCWAASPRGGCVLAGAASSGGACDEDASAASAHAPCSDTASAPRARTEIGLRMALNLLDIDVTPSTLIVIHATAPPLPSPASRGG